jgi:hypothetical protein
MKPLSYIWIGFLVLSSCSEGIDWELKYQEADLLVVEGKITNEAGPHEIRLSLPLYEMNGTPEPVSGREVEIFDGQTVHVFSEDPAREGSYLSPPDFSGEVGRFYQLRVRQGSRRISAVTNMVEVTPLKKPFIYLAQKIRPCWGR